MTNVQASPPVISHLDVADSLASILYLSPYETVPIYQNGTKGSFQPFFPQPVVLTSSTGSLSRLTTASV